MPPPVPLVLASFTGSSPLISSLAPYFPAHPLIPARTSRILGQRSPVPDVSACLERLHAQGHAWAVVQSLHVFPGHEFDRLVAEAAAAPLRVSMGLPLLTSRDDYRHLGQALGPLLGHDSAEAAVLAAHGTDHPAWCACPALEYLLRQEYGERIFVVTVEEEERSREESVARIAQAGFERAMLMPLLLRTGRHSRRDVFGRKGQSWAGALRARGIEVREVRQGLEELPGIVELLARHAGEALEVIPWQAGPSRSDAT